MKLNLTVPAMVFVILAMAFGWLRSCEREKEAVNNAVSEAVERKDMEHRHYIDIVSRRVDSVRLVRTEDSVKFATRISALNASVGHWRKKASEVRPQVDHLADSIPVLRAHLQATDSVIAKLDSTVAVQEGRFYAMSKLHTFEIAQMGEKYVQQVELTEIWKSAAVERETKLKRSERKKRFFRTTTLILGSAVGILILAK